MFVLLFCWQDLLQLALINWKKWHISNTKWQKSKRNNAWAFLPYSSEHTQQRRTKQNKSNCSKFRQNSSYNWDLLVFGPEFAMLRIPRPVWDRLGRNSSLKGFPQKDSPPGDEESVWGRKEGMDDTEETAENIRSLIQKNKNEEKLQK